MKKLFIITSMLICMFSLVSCASTDTGEGETACAIDLVGFANIEEFLDAAENADGGKDDTAQLAILEEIRIPSSIPEEYKLYRITAGAADIAFWFMPEEYLKDDDSRLEAEAFQKHFMYIDSRNSSFESFTEQVKSNPGYGYFHHDKYAIVHTSSCMVNWEEDGRLLSLYLPGHLDIVDGTVVSTDEENPFPPLSLDELCQTEKIVIK